MSHPTEEDDLHRRRVLREKIAKVFDEARASIATHNRKLKELSAIFRSWAAKPDAFFAAFTEALTPLFDFSRKTASAERVSKFVALFATIRSESDSGSSHMNDFLERFLRFLLTASKAANKNARFRACQIVSEIIMRLPDDAEVSDELWDEVIDSMKIRVNDKVPAVRGFSVRALSRFVNDAENSDVLELFLKKLPLEQNLDVRKMIVLSLPPSNATLADVIDCTLDVGESVRKAAYCVLAVKFPLNSLSIKLRTTILQRGLSDRSTAVVAECFNMLKDEWLVKVCNGDPIQLLKYLDVETYEAIGESVMTALLKEGLVKLDDIQGLRQFLIPNSDSTEGHCNNNIQLMEPEVSLYWRTVCRHLQMKAQAKGSDAASTTGTESAVYASEASENNDLLDKVLPASLSEYFELAKAHLVAGPNYRFASRQLLLLGAMLDFSDATNRKVAGELVKELLQKPLDHELDENGIEVVIGDGISLGGDRDWAAAISEFVRKVHAVPGEFEDVVLGILAVLAQPCRERTADYKQWLQCLAVAGFLLEGVQSFRLMLGKSIEPVEILHSLLLPGAKHANYDVQRAAIRCLGLFGLVERKPSQDLVNQLRCSFVKGPYLITNMACMALLDLGVWHGPQELDKAMKQDLRSQLKDYKMGFNPVNWCDLSDLVDCELLDLLYAGIERNCAGDSVVRDEIESVQAVVAEGFAKMLLLSEEYPIIHVSAHYLLSKLIFLYFHGESSELLRLKQCLSVFFEHYPSLSVKHKKCLSKAFVPVMRSLWPGIDDNAKRSSSAVADMRRRATQASRFMLQMMQAPLYKKEDASNDADVTENPSVDFESGEEGLAIRIAAEVAGFHSRKTAAEKSYILALGKVLVLLCSNLSHSSEQEPIKLLRQLLICVAQSVTTERELLKELNGMIVRLKAVDRCPDENLTSDEANLIFGKLEIEMNFDEVESVEVPPTPAPRSSVKTTRTRRRAKVEESSSSSDIEASPTSAMPAPVDSSNLRARSERASKTAALSKLAANDHFTIDEEEEEEDDEAEGESVEEGSSSEVSSEHD